jgi:GNAT superfamily N-acetyltransferase
MTQPTIREATLADAAAIAGLITQLGYPATPAAMHGRLEALLADPDYRTWVAEAAGQVVGVAGAGVGLQYAGDGIRGQLLALVVDELWRRRGIGAALVATVERWLRERGADAVVVNSRHSRLDAHRFYKQLGYQDTGLRFVKALPADEG